MHVQDRPRQLALQRRLIEHGGGGLSVRPDQRKNQQTAETASPELRHVPATRPLQQGPSSRMLNNPYSPRLLKKVQMQGGTTHPTDGYPGAERGVLEVRRSECPSVPTQQMGFFEQPAKQGRATSGASPDQNLPPPHHRSRPPAWPETRASPVPGARPGPRGYLWPQTKHRVEKETLSLGHRPLTQVGSTRLRSSPSHPPHRRTVDQFPGAARHAAIPERTIRDWPGSVNERVNSGRSV